MRGGWHDVRYRDTYLEKEIHTPSNLRECKSSQLLGDARQMLNPFTITGISSKATCWDIQRPHAQAVLNGLPGGLGARPDVLTFAASNEHRIWFIRSAVHAVVSFCRLIISELS